MALKDFEVSALDLAQETLLALIKSGTLGGPQENILVGNNGHAVAVSLATNLNTLYRRLIDLYADEQK